MMRISSVFASLAFLFAVGCSAGGGGHGTTHLDGGTHGDGSSTTCQNPQVPCNGSCVNVLSDNFNCGGCGITCQNGQTCSEGTCGGNTGCGGGQQMCNGSCVNILSDSSNCGFCGHQCATGSSCSNGTCGGTMSGSSGCATIVQCENNCNGDQTCGQNCFKAGSPMGQQLFAAVVTCLFGGQNGSPPGACPGGMGQVCDPMATDMTACNNCINGALSGGGACASQWTACMNNM